MFKKMDKDDVIDIMINMCFLKPKQDIMVNMTGFLSKPHLTVEYINNNGRGC